MLRKNLYDRCFLKSIFGCFVQLSADVPASVHDADNAHCIGVFIRQIKHEVIVYWEKTQPQAVPRFVIIQAVPRRHLLQGADFFHDPLRLACGSVRNKQFLRNIGVDAPQVTLCPGCIKNFVPHIPKSRFISASTSSAEYTLPACTSTTPFSISASNCSLVSEP